MNNQQNRERWAEELEGSLQKAIEAEAGGRRRSAEWLFQKALFLEGQLKEVADPRDYLGAAGPLYEEVGN